MGWDVGPDISHLVGVVECAVDEVLYGFSDLGVSDFFQVDLSDTSCLLPLVQLYIYMIFADVQTDGETFSIKSRLMFCWSSTFDLTFSTRTYVNSLLPAFIAGAVRTSIRQSNSGVSQSRLSRCLAPSTLVFSSSLFVSYPCLLLSSLCWPESCRASSRPVHSIAAVHHNLLILIRVLSY